SCARPEREKEKRTQSESVSKRPQDTSAEEGNCGIIAYTTWEVGNRENRRAEAEECGEQAGVKEEQAASAFSAERKQSNPAGSQDSIRTPYPSSLALLTWLEVLMRRHDLHNARARKTHLSRSTQPGPRRLLFSLLFLSLS